MRTCLLSFVATLGLAGGVLAQTGYQVPRMPDGHPDLEGAWDLATLTPLERPKGVTSLAYARQEELRMEKANAERMKRLDAPLAADRAAPPVGGVGPGGGAGGSVGGYNAFWVDLGSSYNEIDGQYRTSLIIDPPDGHLPPLTEEAQTRIARMRAPTSDATESNDKDLEPTPGAYDDPERRPLGERCLLGFGSTSGPPALPDYFYNNLHRIVQTPDSVMILSEMVHDARIVRMNGRHLPPSVRKWMGHSVGRWEGDKFNRESPRGRAIDPRRAALAAVQIYRRGSAHVDAAVDGRNDVAVDEFADLRVRVPRGELRARRHPARRAHEGKGSSGERFRQVSAVRAQARTARLVSSLPAYGEFSLTKENIDADRPTDACLAPGRARRGTSFRMHTTSVRRGSRAARLSGLR